MRRSTSGIFSFSSAKALSSSARFSRSDATAASTSESWLSHSSCACSTKSLASAWLSRREAKCRAPCCSSTSMALSTASAAASPAAFTCSARSLASLLRTLKASLFSLRAAMRVWCVIGSKCHSSALLSQRSTTELPSCDAAADASSASMKPFRPALRQRFAPAMAMASTSLLPVLPLPIKSGEGATVDMVAARSATGQPGEVA
mmetsp:Transcript_26523/g.58262  ORF Transcript_26523/g.58262 Transcript_26523/m.58262 type:complete len:204 (+) Transcript_26523:623-1234(+)